MWCVGVGDSYSLGNPTAALRGCVCTSFPPVYVTSLGLRPEILLFIQVPFFKKICIYLATSGLGCLTQDLLLWHMGSPVVAGGLSCPAARRVLAPTPGVEPASPALGTGAQPLDHEGSPPSSIFKNILRMRVTALIGVRFLFEGNELRCNSTEVMVGTTLSEATVRATPNT